MALPVNTFCIAPSADMIVTPADNAFTIIRPFPKFSVLPGLRMMQTQDYSECSLGWPFAILEWPVLLYNMYEQLLAVYEAARVNGAPGYIRNRVHVRIPNALADWRVTTAVMGEPKAVSGSKATTHAEGVRLVLAKLNFGAISSLVLPDEDDVHNDWFEAANAGATYEYGKVTFADVGDDTAGNFLFGIW